MKSIINRIYIFTSKLLDLLDIELNEIQKNLNNKSTINIKKNMVDTLYKITNLITHLNKVEDKGNDDHVISKKDQEIIDRFLAKYMKNEK